jgi:hypothetical protein
MRIVLQEGLCCYMCCRAAAARLLLQGYSCENSAAKLLQEYAARLLVLLVMVLVPVPVPA